MLILPLTVVLSLATPESVNHIDATIMPPIRIIISYCHRNRDWLTENENITTGINPLCLLTQWERALSDRDVIFWFDREHQDGLHGGDLWEKRIVDEINRADIAILLMTQDFIISPFIKNKELPWIMERYHRNELLVLPISAEPTRIRNLEKTDLLQLQWTPEIDTPLSKIIEESKNKFEETKIRVLDALELMVERVEEKKRDAEEKLKKEARSQDEVKAQVEREKRNREQEEHERLEKERVEKLRLEKQEKDELAKKRLERKRRETVQQENQEHEQSRIKRQRRRAPISMKTGALLVVLIAVLSLITFLILKGGAGNKGQASGVNEEFSAYEKKERQGNGEQAARQNEKISTPENMVWIEGGTFMMGSENGGDDEKPVHEVTLDGFYMGKTEVTQEEYATIMAATYNGYNSPEWTTGHGKGDNYPAYNVNWYDAVLYCNACTKSSGSSDTVYSYTKISGTPGNGCELNGISIDLDRKGYCLPTEAQWEYACRAGSTTDFYWGKDYDPYPATAADSIEMGSYMVWRGNSYLLGRVKPGYGTHPVGQKIKNGFGLYDNSNYTLNSITH